MLKKKLVNLFFASSLALLFVFCGHGCISKAYAAPALLDLVSDLRILEKKAGVGSAIADTLVSTSGNISWRNDIKSRFSNADFKGYAILFSGNDLYIIASGLSTIVNYSNSPSNGLYNDWKYYPGNGYKFNKTTGAYISNGSFEYNKFNFNYALTNDIAINTRKLTLGVDEEYRW